MNNRARLVLVSAVLISSIGIGCVGRDYQTPAMPTPSTWSALLPSGHSVPLTSWWDIYHEPALNTLITLALTANHDIKIAEARLQEERALVGVVASAYGPQVDVDGSATRSRASSNGVQGERGGGVHTTYQAGFDASWEMDFFGGIHRAVEAADAELSALEETRRDVQVSVCAEVVRSWLDGRTAQARLTIAHDLLSNAEKQRTLIQQRYRAGLVNESAIATSDALVAHLSSNLPALNSAVQSAQHRLAILCGQTPDHVYALGDAVSIPIITDIFAVGIPADVVRQRPDVRRAERELAAATARIGIAEADLYPRFSLTGSFGQLSIASSTLTENTSNFWSIGPSVRWPIFSAGRIRHQVEASDAHALQAAERFEQATLQAYAEVEDALVAVSNDHLQHRALQNRAAAQARILDTQRQLRSHGLIDDLVVLKAEAEHLSAVDAMTVGQHTTNVDVTALAKALGGGWK